MTPVQGPAYYFPSIEKKHGRPINEWIDLIRFCKLTRHKELVDWLKTGYGIGHGHATALVGYTLPVEVELFSILDKLLIELVPRLGG